MTTEDYRGALNSLNAEDFAKFRALWGGTKDTIDGGVQEFAYSPSPIQWERIAIFRLRQVGVVGLLSEAEEALAIANESADAAKTSASVAEVSARSAKSAVTLSLFAVALSVLEWVLERSLR